MILTPKVDCYDHSVKSSPVFTTGRSTLGDRGAKEPLCRARYDTGGPWIPEYDITIIIERHRSRTVTSHKY